MIDNLNLIKELLNFDNEGDFYMLYILKRKKDQTTDKSNHQSVRTIKTYCIESIDSLNYESTRYCIRLISVSLSDLKPIKIILFLDFIKSC